MPFNFTPSHFNHNKVGKLRLQCNFKITILNLKTRIKGANVEPHSALYNGKNNNEMGIFRGNRKWWEKMFEFSEYEEKSFTAGKPSLSFFFSAENNERQMYIYI